MTDRAADASFERIARAFRADARVTRGGKGFGSTGLKVDGKLFAFVSSRGQYVAKLPRARVQQLVGEGAGVLFDPGHGRLMREWIAMDANEKRWLELAKEARAFVGARA